MNAERKSIGRKRQGASFPAPAGKGELPADYFALLGWKSVYAHNAEDFGPGGLLGRASEHEVVLTRPLREKLVALNHGLPGAAYDEAVRQLAAAAPSQSLITANCEKRDLTRDGVPVTCRNDKGERVRERLRVFDFGQPANNDFLCVRELWIRGDLYRHRADLIGHGPRGEFRPMRQGKSSPVTTNSSA